MSTHTPGVEKRLAALLSILLALALVVALGVFLWDHLAALALALVGLAIALYFGWRGMVSRGGGRAWRWAIAAAGVVITVAPVFDGDERALLHLVVILVLAALFAVSARFALRTGGAPAAGSNQGRRDRRGLLIINLRSGGGKAEKFDLEAKAAAMGIEPVVLRPGDDLELLAKDAIARGVDAIGMAGGDGSQALVAKTAAENGVPFVCIPAGTRNHFAMDLGLDRDDPSLALAAFAGEERRIDYGLVNDRLFVNNVSLGLYAKIVHEPGYREAKSGTALRLLPDMLGDDATPFPFRFTGPDGNTHEFAQMVLVSNNPYVLVPGGDVGYRPHLDRGELGILVMAIEQAPDIAGLVELLTADPSTRRDGFFQWAAPTFRLESTETEVLAGIDGEALRLTSPLEFRIVPKGLRVLMPPAEVLANQQVPPDLSPQLLEELLRVARGQSAGSSA